MTIIVYDSKMNAVLCDSLYTFENGRVPYTASKIIRPADDIAFAVAGAVFDTHAISAAVVDVAAKLVSRGTYVTVECDAKDVEGFLKAGDSVWWITTREHEKTRFVDFRRVGETTFGDYYATGSGCSWFSAYYAEHKDAYIAMVHTVEKHASCGAPIEVF